MSWKARIDRRTPSDRRFRRLSKDARLLWYTLLINPGGNGVHGVVLFEPALFARYCAMDVGGISSAMMEILRQGMAAWDHEAGLVVLRKALDYERPANADHARGWAKALDELPECAALDWYRWELADEIAKAKWSSDALLETIRGGLQSEPETVFGTVSETLFDTVSETVSDTVSDTPGNPSPIPSPIPSPTIPGLTNATSSRPAEGGNGSEGPEERDRKREALFEDWLADLAIVCEREGTPPGLVEAYAHELRGALTAYHEKRGTRWTPSRKANLAERLGKLHPRVQLAAIEIFCDDHAGSKDHRYLAQIGSRRAKLTEDELLGELAAHRRRNPGGLFSAATEGAES